jgi:hypothetical protein
MLHQVQHFRRYRFRRMRSKRGQSPHQIRFSLDFSWKSSSPFVINYDQLKCELMRFIPKYAARNHESAD